MSRSSDDNGSGFLVVLILRLLFFSGVGTIANGINNEITNRSVQTSIVEQCATVENPGKCATDIRNALDGE